MKIEHVLKLELTGEEADAIAKLIGCYNDIQKREKGLVGEQLSFIGNFWAECNVFAEFTVRGDAT